MSALVASLIHRAKYAGSHGAIATAEKENLLAAQQGSIGDLMVLSNVYYSAAGYFNSLKNPVHKVRAIYYLFVGYSFTLRALVKQTGSGNFSMIQRLQMLDMRLRSRGDHHTEFGYGDVHIYMSELTHIAKIKRLLRLSVRSEFEKAKECEAIIKWAPSPLLRILARATLLYWHELDPKVRQEIMHETYRFLAHHEYTENKEIQQVLLRIARARGEYGAEKDLAQRFGTNDQRVKAGVPCKSKPHQEYHNYRQE